MLRHKLSALVQENPCVQRDLKKCCFRFLSHVYFIVGWCESEYTWHVGWQMMNGAQSVELELAREIEILGENLPQCNFGRHTGTGGASHKTMLHNPLHSRTIFPWPWYPNILHGRKVRTANTTDLWHATLYILGTHFTTLPAARLHGVKW
jgi:hypothetical protein